MDGQGDSQRGRGHRIDDGAKGIFLAAVKRGAWLRDAARAAGYTVSGFWKERKRDPAFDEAVEEALELSAAPRFIRPTNGRRLQLRRHRRLRFHGWRREVFLAHFAATGNETEAAEAAGVSTATVYRHRVKDPDFAAAHQAALDQSYVRLEAEAVRQRLLAQGKMAEALERGLEVEPAMVAEFARGDLAAEFERMMKLLARWDRRGGGPGPRTVSPAHRRPWTFEEAIEALERKMRSLGIPVRDAPEAGDDSGDGAGEEGDEVQ
jgi:hypothetical protein